MSPPHIPSAAEIKAQARAAQAVGGITALARRCGVSRQHVYDWRRLGIPAELVGIVAKESGEPAASLRPDLARTFAK